MRDSTTSTIDASFIVPCHNEVGNVSHLADEITEQFCNRGITCEIIFVDDGSTDDTLAELCRIVEFYRTDNHLESSIPVVSVISFSRNFGKESALYAGMEASSGDVLCFIDADLQQDPSVAFEMYEYLIKHDQYDVVAAYQDRRSEGRFVGWLKECFYGFFNATSDEIELPPNMSDFRVFRRIVATALLSMPEYFRFSKGLFAWVGFPTYAMPYSANSRLSGKSSWSIRSLFKYALSGISSFSTWPLKILKVIGGLVFTVSLVYLLYVLIVDYCIFGIEIPGYTTLVSLILIFGGLQVAAIGIVGDYLARSYIEGKRRPLFIIQDSFSSVSKKECSGANKH